MITLNGKELRNLEEQVRKNKEDIARHYQATQLPINLAGIEVIGEITSPIELRDKVGDAYGQAYVQVVEDDTFLWIWTRANPDAGEPDDYWLDIPFSVAGPQGPTGEKGETGERGERGSYWNAGTINPDTLANYKVGDFYLNTTTGAVFKVVSVNGTTRWVEQGNITGPAGPMGPRGPIGRTGETGPRGLAGPAGPVGQIVQIIGQVATLSALPQPTTVPRNSAYIFTGYVGASGPEKHLYIIFGTGTNLYWGDAGIFGAGTLIYQNGNPLTILNVDEYIRKEETGGEFARAYAVDRYGTQSLQPFSSFVNENTPECLVQRTVTNNITLPDQISNPITDEPGNREAVSREWVIKYMNDNAPDPQVRLYQWVISGTITLEGGLADIDARPISSMPIGEEYFEEGSQIGPAPFQFNYTCIRPYGHTLGNTGWLDSFYEDMKYVEPLGWCTYFEHLGYSTNEAPCYCTKIDVEYVENVDETYVGMVLWSTNSYQYWTYVIPYTNFQQAILNAISSGTLNVKSVLLH